jgi:hypothetical protein
MSDKAEDEDISFDVGEFESIRDKRLNRQARWARNKYRQERDELVEDMGGMCVDCGAIDNLDIDHEYGKSYDPRKSNRLTMLRRYRKEWEWGMVRLRCRSCNQKRTGRWR